jgi:hypothetical protein
MDEESSSLATGTVKAAYYDRRNKVGDSLLSMHEEVQH